MYDYAALAADIEALRGKYRGVEVKQIGSSVLGTPLAAIRIGRGAKRIHFNGAFHANEWITSRILMRFLEACAQVWSGSAGNGNGYPAYTRKLVQALDDVTLWVVPMVNPDGVDLAVNGLRPDHPYYSELLAMNGGSEHFTGWKANVRGVDLNDQFPAFWEEEVRRRDTDGPGPRDYPGPAPLSEPEALAMAEFTTDEAFHAVFAFHTQGEEIYWNYRGYEPHGSREWAEALGAACDYKAVELSGSDAGYKDWFIQEFRRPGFTVEAGFGVNPLPIEQFDAIYAKLFPMMVEALCLPRDLW